LDEHLPETLADSQQGLNLGLAISKAWIVGPGKSPQPKRSELEALLRDYTRYVIDEAWPLQRKGIVPAGAVKRVADFQASLVGFGEPLPLP
jgi:hypothetical protein